MGRHAQSIDSQILRRFIASRGDRVFTAGDFLDLGTRNTVDAALSRQARTGRIRKLARGLYDLPRRDPQIGLLMPSAELVAKALRGRDAVRLQPSGAHRAPGSQHREGLLGVLDTPRAVPNARVGRHIVFKGGTSLSKAWKLIERFSEDIDIVIDRAFLGFGGEQDPDVATSHKKQRQRLDRLKTACQDRIQHALLPTLAAQFGAVLGHETDWKIEEDAADPDRQSLLFF